MAQSRSGPFTIALFVVGALIGLGAAGWWYFGGTPRAVGPSTEPRGTPAADRQRTQPPDILWERTYGGARIDAARRILPWGKDGFVVAGRTRSKGQGGDDVWLVFLDADGKEIGERLLGSPDFDWLTAMIRTRDGGLALTGSRTDRQVTRSSGWLVRLDPKGDELWRHELDGGNKDGASGFTAIDEFAEGGYVVAGSTTVNAAGRYDGWVMALDKDGKQVWQKVVGGADEDALFGVAALADGGVVAAGAYGTDGQGWLLRFDAKGTLAWEKRFGGAGYDVFNAVIAARPGGFVVAGATHSKGPAGGAAWVMRLDDKGDPLWERLLTPVKAASANSVVALADGGYLVVGGSVVPDAQSGEKEKAWMTRLGADGAVLWTKLFESTGHQNIFSAVVLADGGIVVAGFTETKGAGEGDIWVVRLGYK